VVGNWQAWLEAFKPHAYARRQPLILVNGLAEQGESWYRNQHFWRRYFDVHLPNILAYDGAFLHRRIEEGLPISVEYLVEQLHHYLEAFVQAPPYHLVASSLGGKVAVEYAARHPDRVDRLVLLCPSGLGDEERLPVVEGVRRNDFRTVIDSVFYDPRQADPRMRTYYERQLPNRKWRIGLLRTIRGTLDHCIRDRLPEVGHPTLLIVGRDDRIIDPEQAEVAVRLLPRGQLVTIPQCGHAPQLEKPSVVNRLVVHFLTSPDPASAPQLGELLAAKPSKVTS
jgi:pimeloyl-ACP methyl ester carboxylesterase